MPTLNLPAAEASLALAAFVFRTGLLSGADAGDIGFHRGTLGETIGEPAERALRDAGVEVRLGWRAERLERSAGGVEVHGRGARAESASLGESASGEDASGGGESSAAEPLELLGADATVLAVPHLRAARLLELLLGESASVWRGLGSSPIINLHVVYDRVVCEVPFAAGVGTPVQYLFDRSDAAGVPAGCQYLAVSLSGAEREMGISSSELRERYVPALGELFPVARGAKVEFFLATREHAATFRAAPGAGALRPRPQTAVPGLVLAGAWTATGWPATLEGAVLSGHAAAEVALRGLGLDPGAALLHACRPGRARGRPRKTRRPERRCRFRGTPGEHHRGHPRAARGGADAHRGCADLLGSSARPGAQDRHGPETLPGRGRRARRRQRSRDARARLLRRTRRAPRCRAK